MKSHSPCEYRGGATFLPSNHFLFFAKKCLYASKRIQNKSLSRKRVYSKHKSIKSARMPNFRVLKIKNAKVCLKNLNHPLQIKLKPRFAERKNREDENQKSWRLMCVRTMKIFTGQFGLGSFLFITFIASSDIFASRIFNIFLYYMFFF